MDGGFTQQVCFCRIHGTIMSQTLPRQVAPLPQLESPHPPHIKYDRSRVLQNQIKGAFNNIGAESIEDLTNRFSRVGHHDINSNSQHKHLKKGNKDLCSYRQYDTVDQDIHMNTMDLAYINNTSVNHAHFPTDFSENNIRDPFTNDSFYQSSQDNYYDPVHCGENEVSHLILPEGMFVRPKEDFRHLSSNNVYTANTRSPNNHKKDRRAGHRKSKARREESQDGAIDELYMAINHPVSPNSRSAPTSPAQNCTKPRRRRRENHSHRPNFKKVFL